MKTADVLAYAKKVSELGPTLARDDLRVLDDEIIIAITINLCMVLATKEEALQEARELALKIAKLAELR